MDKRVLKCLGIYDLATQRGWKTIRLDKKPDAASSVKAATSQKKNDTAVKFRKAA